MCHAKNQKGVCVVDISEVGPLNGSRDNPNSVEFMSWRVFAVIRNILLWYGAQVYYLRGLTVV